MQKDAHERAVCDAAIALIKKKLEIQITYDRSPDQEQRQTKAPDHVYTSSIGNFILEHTRIESFPGQISDDIRIKTQLKQLQDNLSGNLTTPGYYRLGFDVHVLEGEKNPQKIREKLEEWVKQNAGNLEIGQQRYTDGNSIRTIPPGVKFEVILSRWESETGKDGQLYIYRNVPKDLDTQRRKRIQRALDDKLEKLTTEKNQGDVTVLVLESNDMALGNVVDIAEATLDELAKRTGDIPDIIVLVETELEPWYVWMIKDNDEQYPEVREPWMLKI